MNEQPVQVHGDATPFVMDVAGTLALVVAGQVEGPHVAAVEVNGKRCAVGRVGWVSEPFPMDPGMELQIVWLGRDGAPVRTINTGPLESQKLGPLFGPDWTSYGPPAE